MRERQSNKVIDFEVGGRTKETYLKLTFRIEKKYKIEHLCTDDYSAYKYYKISKHHHVTKAETSLDYERKLRTYITLRKWMNEDNSKFFFYETKELKND